jgi:hypothetical protein
MSKGQDCDYDNWNIAIFVRSVFPNRNYSAILATLQITRMAE